MMLKEVESFFTNKYSKHKCELKNVPHSCCSICNCEVFSFDDVKTELYQELKAGQHLRSVDVLYFHIEKNILFLIEMKSFRDKIKTLNDITKDDFIKFINEHVYDGTIISKTIDSLFVISTILSINGIDKNVKTCLLDKKNFRIKSILLSDFSYEEYTVIELAGLDKRKISISTRIEDEIDILNCLRFNRLFT